MPSKRNPSPPKPDTAPTGTGIVPPSYHLPPSSLTLSRIKAAIPAHCFNRSVVISTQYLLQDVVILTALYWVASQVLENWEAPWMAQWAVWSVWQAVGGAVGFGVWITSWGMRHGAYSAYPLLNHTVGLIFHSLLLVPYFSWQLSHAKHHHYTGHHAFDEAFVPRTRSSYLPGTTVKDKVVLDKEENRSKVERVDTGCWASPLESVIGLLIMWIVGFPYYLAVHAQGRDYGKYVCYLPKSPIYLPRQRPLIFLSDIGVLAVLAGLGYWAHISSFAVVVKYYGVLNWVFHHMWVYYERVRRATDTHVVHHLFPTIPHYHAMEATYHVRKLLESEGLYVHDDSNVVHSAYKAFRECRFIEDEGELETIRAAKTE
ncbi:hypothetical protein M427DRAFT_493419 [Gonapodya prolifera JEL478]|uniref:Fatty acid desaturase domain-containing protein n=1 Tax=Gonapodya prolifera (strain JEL478) TaxID=1344416 RepID=A0A139AJK8_GONPJ|nr:hypothetical protein M427DRAFT_493419 [Gonapodya prolifera JEL478]|eukprot:KXS16996.1 hypothetical protein M427DRAFT_493419 [Gonapodya prolifera JEL478]